MNAAGQRLRVVFHAGFHKTGTTSLQDSLAAHAAALAPDIQVQTRKTSAALSCAADLARDWSVTRDGAATARLAAALDLWAAGLNLSPGQTLLASSEDFAGHMPGHRGLSDYSAAPALARAVTHALRARFGPGLDLHFLYTSRLPEPWLRSIHWQLAGHPMMEMGAGKFARRFARAADFGPLLQAIRAAVPGVGVTAQALESLTARRLGPVSAIYDLAGLDATGLPPIPATNQRPPHDLADAFVALNRAGIPPKLLAQMKRGLIALSDGAAKTLPPPLPPR